MEVVKGEIHNVLACLRSNTRWATAARFFREIPVQDETPLLRAFKQLHDYLHRHRDLAEVDSLRYLLPFLEVIRSEDTSGPITAVALSAVNKFMLYGLLQRDSLRAREAINAVAGAVTTCRFESASEEQDAATLMTLLEVLENTLRCSAGPLLTNESAWLLVQCAHRISQLERASHLLRRGAESALQHFILTVFSRLPELAAVPSTGGGTGRTAAPCTPQVVDAAAAADADGSDAVLLPAWFNRAKPTADAGVHPTGVPASAAGDHRGSNSDQAAAAPRDAATATAATMATPATPSTRAQTTPSQGGAPGPLVVGAAPSAPYGEALIARLLSWLAALTDPRANSPQVRELALRLVNIALEMGGEELGRFPTVVKAASSELCKFLVQNSTTDDLQILSLVLRVVFNLFAALKRHLKVPLEIFFTSVHLVSADGTQSPSAERRELALESLIEFAREPAMMADLYVNYDCDVQCSNLFESLAACLCRNAVPAPRRQLTSLNVLAVEGVLAVLEGIARRCLRPPSGVLAIEGGATSPPASSPRLLEEEAAGEEPLSPSRHRTISTGVSLDTSLQTQHPALRARLQRGRSSELAGSSASLGGSGSPAGGGGSGAGARLVLDPAGLRRRKHLKRRLALAAERFNMQEGKHKGWVEYAQQLSVLPAPASPEAVATFLKRCPGLDRELVGLYISEPDEPKYRFQTAVREAFINGFEFGNLRIDAAMRVYLSAFRLPGEAQKIDRLMEGFANRFFECSLASEHPDPLSAADTAFVLSFAIVMLQTDQHSGQVKTPMEEDGFIRNLRGIDNGKDLPREYLAKIFHSIAEKALPMPLPQAPGGQQRAAPEPSADLSEEAADGSAAAHGRASAQLLWREWDGVMRREKDVEAYRPSAPSEVSVWAPAGEAERHMFQLLAGDALKAISAVASATADETTMRRCLQGLGYLAHAAAYFGLCSTLSATVKAAALLTKSTIVAASGIPASSLPWDGISLGPSFSLPSSSERSSLHALSGIDSVSVAGGDVDSAAH